jgi:hypothetical protein
MNTVRPAQRVLPTLSPLKAPRPCHIRQWHPRSTSQIQLRKQSTIILPPNYKPRSRYRPFIWALAFGITGYALGKTVNSYLNFFDHIERDSDEDRLLLAAITLAADDIPAIQQLLKNEGDVDSEWDELAIEPHEGDALLNETLRGSMGVTTPRAFWNAKERELWMVVHYGPALCGWPGIAHGGCTATVLLEGMGRALNALEGRTHSPSLPGPEHLGLTYLKPVKAGQFYLLKAKLKESGSAQSILPDSGIGAEKDLAKKVQEERSGMLARLNKKYDVDCVLESLDGKQCMRAKGVWDVV